MRGECPLDVVKLARAAGGWPAGTEATLLAVREGLALLERRDEEITEAPVDALKIVWRAPIPA